MESIPKSNSRLYYEFIHDEAVKGCKLLTTLAILLFPAFSLLDFFVHPDHFNHLSLIRYGTTAIFLFVHLMFRQNIGLKNPFFASTSLLAFAAFSITLMCLVLDGSNSPYYAGVNLVILAGVLILPANGRYMALTVFFSILIYALGIFFYEGPTLVSPGNFINNLFFLTATGIIGISAAVFTNRMRKESFYRLLEIERSSNVLQAELQTHHVNIESLAREIIAKKTEAQNALELRNGFISIASHELKTPLTSLKLQVDLARLRIEKDLMDQSTIKTMVHSFSTPLSRIIRIVDEMLDISRIQSGKFDIEKIHLDLDDLIKNLLTRYYPPEDVKSKLISYKSSGAVFGNIDPFKIEQVLINLLTNAFRYGLDKEIHLSLEQAGAEAVIKVKDFGLGIKPEDHQRIFEKFERGVPSRNFGGLGLGLFICKHIVDAHQGSIHLQSEVNRGSEFTVKLPLS